MQQFQNDIDKLINDLDLIQVQQNYFSKSMASINDQDAKLSADIINIQNKYANNISAKEYYIKAVDILYEKSIGELEAILNNALSFIFYDKEYSIKFDIENNSRTKSLKIFIKENDNLINLKSGTGASVRSIVSLVLLIYYITSKKAYPALFLDETYTKISSDYIEKFFEYIRLFCEQNNFSLILITHDIRYMDYADYSYTIADGQIISSSGV